MCGVKMYMNEYIVCGVFYIYIYLVEVVVIVCIGVRIARLWFV